MSGPLIPHGPARERFIEEVMTAWVDRTCPWCGNGVSPIWMAILSSYVVQCKVCGEVLESFELYADTTGHIYTENRQLHDPLGTYPFRPLRTRKAGA